MQCHYIISVQELYSKELTPKYIKSISCDVIKYYQQDVSNCFKRGKDYVREFTKLTHQIDSRNCNFNFTVSEHGTELKDNVNALRNSEQDRMIGYGEKIENT